MDSLHISATSTEVVYVKVTGRDETGLIDPTSGAVSAAVLAESLQWVEGDAEDAQFSPEDDDYEVATWETWPGPVYKARVLIGPDAALVPAGPTGTATAPVRHALWLSWTNGAETVRRQVAWLLVGR
jgi:hypothetical protein